MGKADGWFGKLQHRKSSFKKSKGLKQDGIVGPNTLKAMLTML